MDLKKVIIEFIITFIIIYLFYYFFVIRKCKKNKKVVPPEVNIILSLYKIDINKINLYQMIKVVSVVTTFVLSITITIMWNLFNSTVILLIFGSLLSVIIAFICYGIIGRVFEKASKKQNK